MKIICARCEQEKELTFKLIDGQVIQYGLAYPCKDEGAKGTGICGDCLGTRSIELALENQDLQDKNQKQLYLITKQFFAGENDGLVSHVRAEYLVCEEDIEKAINIIQCVYMKDSYLALQGWEELPLFINSGDSSVIRRLRTKREEGMRYAVITIKKARIGLEGL